MQLHFSDEAEFGAWFCLLHFGSHLAANLYKDRTLADVFREAKLDAMLAQISDLDATQQTPAGTHMRQLRQGRGRLAVDGEMLAMIDRYIRYAAEKSAPDWAATAAIALTVVQRAQEGGEGGIQ